MRQQKLPGTFHVDVPFKNAGNAIKQNTVEFEVFHLDDNYSAHPLLSENERRIANLPEELNFTYKDGVLVSSRGKMDGNFHVLESIAQQLEKRKRSAGN